MIDQHEMLYLDWKYVLVDWCRIRFKSKEYRGMGAAFIHTQDIYIAFHNLGLVTLRSEIIIIIKNNFIDFSRLIYIYIYI